jgi:S-adenosylmethionine hydrolase
VRGVRADAIFLLTDYGDEDEFAGVTRAVLLRHAPGAPLVDLSHRIPPFDVRAGALALARSAVSLGPGVVIAVVDPGVGTNRRAVAVSVAGVAAESGSGREPSRRPPSGGPRHLVGPDNGLLGWAIDALGGATAAVELPPATAAPADGAPDGAGTFDGRDVFAPAAARLWLGATLNDLGLPIDPGSLVRLAEPALNVSEAGAGGSGDGGSVEAEVLWVDRFGNVQLAARVEDAGRAGLENEVEIVTGSGTQSGTQSGRRVRSFGALEGDEVGLLVDANGRLALVCDRRSAATVLGVRAGDVVTLRRAPR